MLPLLCTLLLGIPHGRPGESPLVAKHDAGSSLKSATFPPAPKHKKASKPDADQHAREIRLAKHRLHQAKGRRAAVPTGDEIGHKATLSIANPYTVTLDVTVNGNSYYECYYNKLRLVKAFAAASGMPLSSINIHVGNGWWSSRLSLLVTGPSDTKLDPLSSAARSVVNFLLQKRILGIPPVDLKFFVLVNDLASAYTLRQNLATSFSSAEKTGQLLNEPVEQAGVVAYAQGTQEESKNLQATTVPDATLPPETGAAATPKVVIGNIPAGEVDRSALTASGMDGNRIACIVIGVSIVLFVGFVAWLGHYHRHLSWKETFMLPWTWLCMLGSACTGFTASRWTDTKRRMQFVRQMSKKADHEPEEQSYGQWVKSAWAPSMPRVA